MICVRTDLDVPGNEDDVGVFISGNPYVPSNQGRRICVRTDPDIPENEDDVGVFISGNRDVPSNRDGQIDVGVFKKITPTLRRVFQEKKPLRHKPF